MNEHAKTISHNIKRLAFEAGKTQADISKDLKINKSTLSCWMNGVRIPKMENIDVLCRYFGVNRSDIMDEQKEVALSEREIELLALYRKLSPEGQARLIERAQEMQFVPMYQKGETSSILASE